MLTKIETRLPVGWMLRDKNSGRWHNWGGLDEWLPDSPRCGAIHLHVHENYQERLDFLTQFAANYGVPSVNVELVPVYPCYEIDE